MPTGLSSSTMPWTLRSLRRGAPSAWSFIVGLVALRVLWFGIVRLLLCRDPMQQGVVARASVEGAVVDEMEFGHHAHDDALAQQAPHETAGPVEGLQRLIDALLGVEHGDEDLGVGQVTRYFHVGNRDETDPRVAHFLLDHLRKFALYRSAHPLRAAEFFGHKKKNSAATTPRRRLGAAACR